VPHSKHPHPENDEPENGQARDSAAAQADSEQPAMPADPPAADELAKLRTEKAELLQTLLRRQADFENYRKRVEREGLEASQRGVARVIEDLLPALDAFERAIAAHDDPAYEEYRKGFELIYRQLWDALARHGLVRIEAEGRHFDPHFHQAVERVESADFEDGSVVAVLQQGYTLRGRVIRPALVRVAAHPQGMTHETEPQVN
jgi:molecular chaperone GrpE